MSELVFDPQPCPTVAVAGDDRRLPVRRIFCVGRNYAAHAREMGRDPDREPPFFFTKPADAVVDNDATLDYPPQTNDLHYEIELVIAIGRDGRDLTAETARRHIWGAGVGIDLTRRDLQLAAREAGRPWDWGKAFDASAPCAPITPLARVPSLERGRIWLAVNGEIKQDADLADLIWDVDEIVAIASQSMTLKAGDLIYTGTPAGVGPVEPGDVITGGVDGLGEIRLSIAPGGKA